MMAQQQTNWPFIINVGNSIIGVTILAMPFCFQKCGIILGSLMLFFSTWLTIKSCQLLVKAGIASRRRSFSLLAYFTHGATGKLIVELCMIGLQLGTLVAQVVIIGDLGPAIVSKATGFENTSNLRTSLIVCLCLFVGFPLGLLKDLRTLSKASTMCILFYTFFTCYVVIQSIPNIVQGDWYTKIRFWRIEGFFQCLPIFSFAFGCQTQLFIVYNALTEPSLKRINSIISAAVLLCMVAYMLVAFFGYIAFCNEKELTGDIINHFNENNVSDAIKLCFVISIAVSIPLIVFPCRTSLYTLLFPQERKQEQEGVSTIKPKEDVPGSGKIPEQHFQIITAAIIIGAMVTGILVPNVEFVLGLTGATMGTLICYICPALFFIQVMSESSEGRITSKIVLIAGLIVLIASTYTILNTPDKLPEVVSLDKGLVDNQVADSAKIINKREGSEDLVKADMEIKYKPPDSDGGVKRQEPPIPQAPLDTAKIAVKYVDGDKIKKPNEDYKNGKDDTEVDIEQYKKENIKLREEKERLEEEEQKRKKEEEKKKDGEEKLKEEKEREEEEKREEEEQKRKVAEKKQEQILNKLEQQQEEQEKLIQEQKEILQELKRHKDDHKEAAIDQNDPVLSFQDKTAQKQQDEAMNQEFAKPFVEKQGQVKIPNQLVQGQPYIQGQLVGQNQLLNLQANVQETQQHVANEHGIGQQFNLLGQHALQNHVLSNPQQGQKLVLKTQGVNQNYKGQLNHKRQVDVIQQNIAKNVEKPLLNIELDEMKHRGKRDIDDKTKLDEEVKHSEVNKDVIEHKFNIENDKETIQMNEDKVKNDTKEENIENGKEELKKIIQKTPYSDNDSIVIKPELNVSDKGEDNFKNENKVKQDNTFTNNKMKDIKVLKDKSDNNGQRELKMVDENNPGFDIKLNNVIDYVDEALKEVKNKLKYGNSERMNIERLNILHVQDTRSKRKR